MQEVDGDRGQGAGGQPPEPSPGGGPPPEHGDDEGGEQGRVEEREQRLDVVHDAVEPGRDAGRADGDHDPDHGGDAAEAHVVLVRFVLADVGPPQVVADHGVEGGHVRRHPGHEGGQQPGDGHPEHPAGQVPGDQDGDGVVELQVAGLGPQPLDGDGRDQPGTTTRKGMNSLGKAAIRGVRRAADRFLAARARWTSAKLVVQ